MRMPPGWSSAVILAGRVLLLSLAAGALALGFVVSRVDDRSPSVTAQSFVCPMHPNVTSSSPGDCSICRMALEPVTAHEKAAGEPDPAALTLPAEAALTRFDALSRVKRYDTSLEMRAPAWAESDEVGVAILHRDASEILVPDEEGRFYPSSPPEDGAPPGIPVRVTAEPPVKWDRATAAVRFRVAAGARLSPAQTGFVKFATRIRHGLVVRASAVLDSPQGPYVLVVADDKRTLTRRHVEIGSVIYGYAAVVSGLREHEHVAATHTFFLDAERRLRGGTP